MHIKRLLSGSLAAMMVATSFNVPINVKAAEVPDTEPAAGLEENQELPSLMQKFQWTTILMSLWKNLQ
ncbi:hypothetical protein [Pseudobutyrivibrio sp.]